MSQLTVFIDTIVAGGDSGSATSVATTAAYDFYSTPQTIASTFKVEIFDPIFDYTKFYNAQLVKRIMQVPQFSASFYDITINDTEQYLLQNAPLRLKINGRPMFVGIIKRVNKDDNKRTIDIISEGNSCILRDYIVEIEREYTHTNPLTIIGNLLPATNWTLVYDTTDTASIDYTVNTGSALSHISNICKLKGYEWMTDIEYTECQIEVANSYTHFTLNYYPQSYMKGYYGVIVTGVEADKGFVISDVTDNEITTDTAFPSLMPGDTIGLWGKHELYITDRLGTTTTQINAIANYNAAYLQFASNLDKVINDITTTGVTAQMIGATSQYTYNSFQIATVDCIESYLVENHDTATSTLWIKDASDFTSSNVYQIGKEKVLAGSITDWSTSWSMDVTRAYDSTSAAKHYVNDDIVNITELKVTDTTGLGFLQPGTIWIGKEKIEYTTVGANSFSGLTRGVDSTATYSHYKGTLVMSATWSNDNAQPHSPASVYGIRSARYEGYGITTQDGLDKYAGRIMLLNYTNNKRGTFTYLNSDIWKDIELGSNISVTDKDGNTGIYRLVGLNYNQYQPLQIEFGFVDNYILDSFNKIDMISNIAAQKGKNLQNGTVIDMTSDGNKLKVKLTDTGKEMWVDT